MIGPPVLFGLPWKSPLIGSVVGGAIGTSMAVAGVGVVVVVLFSLALATCAGCLVVRLEER